MVDSLSQALILLSEIFPHPPMTEARLGAFRAALGDLSPWECDAAFRILSLERDRQFFPSPGEILEAARPAPKAVDVAPLYDLIEGRILFRKGNLDSIEVEFGRAARLAVQAAGGLDVIRNYQEGRVFTLKRFTEAYLDADRADDRMAIGAGDERVKALVSATGKRVPS